MSKETAKPAYVATVTGSKGQVIAKFRVKAIKAERPDTDATFVRGVGYPKKRVMIPVLGLAVTSTESRPFFVVGDPERVCTLIEANGDQVRAGYVRGSGVIIQDLPIQVNQAGRAQGTIVTHSCQRQSPHARFVGLWCPAFDAANESNRRRR
jgi:hypothetical protein